MRKLKSLDVPDVIKSVKSKKLPKEALKAILQRFKLDGEIELKEPVETLKSQATTMSLPFIERNKTLKKILDEAQAALEKTVDL